MSAVSIVVHFNVLEYRLPYLLPGANSFAMDCLNLERMEEALGAGIVVAVAPLIRDNYPRIILGTRYALLAFVQAEVDCFPSRHTHLL